MTTSFDILSCAQEKIRDIKHWAQGGLAFTKNHKYVRDGPTDPEADCWCARGAVLACGAALYSKPFIFLDRAAVELYPRMACGNVIWVNDNHSYSKKEIHSRIMKIFDRAKEMALTSPTG